MEKLFYSPVLVSLPPSHISTHSVETLPEILPSYPKKESFDSVDSDQENNSPNEKQEMIAITNTPQSRILTERREKRDFQTKQVLPNPRIKTQNLNQENQENLDPMLIEKRPATKQTSTRHYSNSKRESRLYSMIDRKPKKQTLADFLFVTKRKTDFGTLVTGQVLEDTLEIKNQSGQDIWVQLEVDCFNQDLQETEEYVYSLRRDYAQDYNDRHYVFMAADSTAYFRMAIKVPLVKSPLEIIGETRIMVQGLSGMHRIPMRCTALLPKIICPKELFHQQLKHNIIKLAIKAGGRKQESKMPLKNCSNVPVTLDFGFYAAPNKSYSCFVYPTCVTLPPNGMIVLTILVKNNSLQITGPNTSNQTVNQVLVGKIPDSSVFYTFPLSIDLY